MARTFEARPAVREQVPVLVGLFGPSGGGKTYTALELATGFQAVSGGEIFVIDTEARRALHYADRFQFQHVPFDAPFGSLDYLEALRYCTKRGARTIIIDSMSHEHEGPGGYLESADAEWARLGGGGNTKLQSFVKPVQQRRHLINGILQLNCNMIFCFRAKEKVKPIRKGGKTEIEPQGWMPIAGEEFAYEMTLRILLPPNSRGVPRWESEHDGESAMIKLPAAFQPLFPKNTAIDRRVGDALARWGGGAEARLTKPANAQKTAPASSPHTAPPYHEAPSGPGESSEPPKRIDAGDDGSESPAPFREEPIPPEPRDASEAGTPAETLRLVNSQGTTYAVPPQKWRDTMLRWVQTLPFDDASDIMWGNKAYLEEAEAAGYADSVNQIRQAWADRQPKSASR